MSEWCGVVGLPLVSHPLVLCCSCVCCCRHTYLSAAERLSFEKAASASSSLGLEDTQAQSFLAEMFRTADSMASSAQDEQARRRNPGGWVGGWVGGCILLSLSRSLALAQTQCSSFPLSFLTLTLTLTLHPTPYTLHPTPYTLHPTPLP